MRRRKRIIDILAGDNVFNISEAAVYETVWLITLVNGWSSQINCKFIAIKDNCFVFHVGTWVEATLFMNVAEHFDIQPCRIEVHIPVGIVNSFVVHSKGKADYVKTSSNAINRNIDGDLLTFRQEMIEKINEYITFERACYKVFDKFRCTVEERYEYAKQMMVYQSEWRDASNL